MILDDIVSKKKCDLKENTYLFDIEKFNKNNKHVKSFKETIKKPGLSIIGEIKRASPSRGIIKEDFNPVKIAKEYEGAVDCLSVLTEKHFFKGDIQYLKDVHKAVDMPILRKDFIISPLQIFEAKEAGASCILLITAMLDSTLLAEYLKLAHGIGLDAIVEVHNEKELDIAISANSDIIGINNRNLLDFSEDINNTVRLKKLIPENITVISESSIHTSDDIKILASVGVDVILVGESFMKSQSIKNKANEFRIAYREAKT